MDVKALRAEFDLSQQELADFTGIPRSRIAKWEEGKGTPKVDDWKVLDNFFATKRKEKQLKSKSEQANNYLEQRRNDKLSHVTEGIPIYEDAPYTLGNYESYRETPTEKADFWITIPGLRNCNYGIRATGDSMHPLIRNQALVVGEEIMDTSFIPSGDIYIIRAKNGLETVKYIHPHEDDSRKFLLVPFNKGAKTTDILKKDIIKIWKAKAVFNVL